MASSQARRPCAPSAPAACATASARRRRAPSRPARPGRAGPGRQRQGQRLLARHQRRGDAGDGRAAHDGGRIEPHHAAAGSREACLDVARQQGLRDGDAQAGRDAGGQQRAGMIRRQPGAGGDGDHGQPQQHAQALAQQAAQRGRAQRAYAHDEDGQGGHQARRAVGHAGRRLQGIQQGRHRGQHGAQIQAHQDDGGHLPPLRYGKIHCCSL